MATAGMRVLVLAALAVGLLAAAVSGARDAMKVARGLVPTDGAAPGGAGAAGQQRKGARILAAETFAHHALCGRLPRPHPPPPGPRHQYATLLSPLPLFPLLPSAILCSPCLSFSCSPSHSSAPVASHSSAPLASHSSAPFVSQPCAPLLIPLLLLPLIPLLPVPFIPLLPLPLISLLPLPPPLLCAEVCAHMAVRIFVSYSILWAHDACGRTTVTIRSQYLGPYDLHNDIYNMTFYNGCAYNVTSPLRVYQCFNFGNVWEGILDNPAPNPTQYQQGEIFVQVATGSCEMRMNRGASGTLQMLPGETVNIVYAYTWDFRPCVQELRFGNGNSYSMTNSATESQPAADI
ncbi:unnamed protein product [Closterium sp. Yama58-4]|nr:unnamed protein product [Closterium sp. Yama58-4]